MKKWATKEVKKINAINDLYVTIEKTSPRPNPPPSPTKSDEISVPVWWRANGILYRRDDLPEDHPEHTYNYIVREYGLRPEEFGVYKTPCISCPSCGGPPKKD